MPRRIRWRRVGKRAGIGVLVAIAALWLESGWWEAYRAWPSAGGTTIVAVRSGYVMSVREMFPDGESRWRVDRISPSLDPWWRWWTFEFGRFVGGGTTVYAYFLFPLWVPWIALLLPTLWLWRLDRRRTPGSCPKCGYDLTGNTTGVCPECGSR